jgi:hypothetical protein
MLTDLHPAFVSGFLFAVSWFIFADAAITANREPDPSNHFTFTMAIPGLFSFIAFVMINLTKPSNFHDAEPRERGLLFLGWVLALSSSIGALGICGEHFVGTGGTRLRSYPGVAIVLHTCLMALGAVALWWAKGDGSSGSNLQW